MVQVAIPLRKVKRANQSENVEKPSQKYLQVTTTDNFEFWFMGFLKYKKTFNFQQKIVSQVFWCQQKMFVDSHMLPLLVGYMYKIPSVNSSPLRWKIKFSSLDSATINLIIFMNWFSEVETGKLII